MVESPIRLETTKMVYILRLLWVILGLYRDYIRIMENEMETTIMRYVLELLYWGQ